MKFPTEHEKVQTNINLAADNYRVYRVERSNDRLARLFGCFHVNFFAILHESNQIIDIVSSLPYEMINICWTSDLPDDQSSVQTRNLTDEQNNVIKS